MSLSGPASNLIIPLPREPPSWHLPMMDVAMGELGGTGLAPSVGGAVAQQTGGQLMWTLRELWDFTLVVFSFQNVSVLIAGCGVGVRGQG